MGTELSTWRVASPTPELSKQLSRPDLIAHRQGIVSEVKVVLSAYFQPHEDSDTVTGQLAWWADELHDWTREQVVWGLRKWNRDEPRRRPTPGDILGILKKQRGTMEAKRNPRPADPAPVADRITPERAAEIMQEAGFSVKRFD